MGEMETFSETILGWKIGVKNSKMENWCKNPGSLKNFQSENRHEKLFCSENGKKCISR